jgi:hypothetical protein
LGALSFPASLALLPPLCAIVAGAILQGCPQRLTDDFSTTTRHDASPGVTAADCAPFDVCTDECVDLESDALHCGACGTAIGEGEICSRGSPISADVGCGARRLCDRGCVDTQNNPFHCGGCGVACQRGGRCMMGRCECPAGTRDCGSSCRPCCADPDCPMEKTCSDGECVLSCSLPLAACMDRCVDLQTEPKHCGRCGNDCGPMGSCVTGACLRP